MGIIVELPDGREIEVDTDDPQVAARAAHSYQQRNRAAQQERDFRAPRGAPGTPLRALEDFNRNGIGGAISQAWRQMPFSDEAARLFGGAGNEQYLRQERERVAREQPGVNAAATAMNIIGMAGNPTAALPRIGMLQGGAAAAGVNAPFALARQEGSLEERIPGALRESATVFGLGTALTGGANLLARQAPQSGRTVQNMDRLGIPPTAAGASRNPIVRSLTQLAAQNLITGPRIRGNLTRSLEGTRDAAGRVGGRFGQAAGVEGAGQTAQQGLQRSARDASLPNPSPGANPMAVSTRGWGFAAKAREVFNHVLRPIARAPAAPTTTRATLQSIQGRAAPAAVEFRSDPVMGQFAAALDDIPNPTITDLRELRRGVREAQDRVALDGQTVDNAGLQRIEAALTEDMYAAARNAGGPQLEAQLRRADEFYRRGRERIQSALQAIGGNNATPAQAYNSIIRAMSSRTPNTRALINLRRTLRDDEWQTVQASIVEQMGRVPARRSGVGADINFSVEEFAAAWRNMDPAARRIVFGANARNGGRQLFQDLDDLAEIAAGQRAIEAATTPSGRDVQAAVLGGIGVANIGAAGGIVLALGITGEMLTNASFVRWLTSAARSGTRAGGARGSLAALSQIAARDPAIVPYLEAYRAQLEGPQSASPATRQPEPAAR